MKLVVDGRAVEVEPGTTVLEACRAAGADVPTLCHDDRLRPIGACRACQVGIDGGALATACDTLCADGMRIDTRDERATAVAREVVELVLSELPERAIEADPLRSELVRAVQMVGAAPARFAGERHRRGTDMSHPYVKLDRDLCIACGRCVRICEELQGTFALTLGGRGFETWVVPGAGEAWVDSPCVSCGACVDTCPTGALQEPGFLESGRVDRTVTTTCGYCGVGCSLDVHVRDEAVIAATPTRGAPVNRGHACVKGRFAHGFAGHPDRLTRPLVREGSRLVEASWDVALERVADGLVRARDEHGPESVAVLSSSRATNEDNYAMQKLVRCAFGTHNIDNCCRGCHAPSAAGLRATFGYAGGTAPFDDIERAQAFLLCGANATEAHPVVGARIKQAVIAGTRLVVVDPRRIELADYADLHLKLRPGTNVALFGGLAHVLLRDGLADESYLAARAEGLDELREVVAGLTPERTAEICGVVAADVERAAHIYGEAEAASIVYGLGVTEHRHGTDGVRSLANLAVLCGNVGIPGGGVNPLRGQSNVQGASDIGAIPDFLPGYVLVDDEEGASRFEAAWQTRLPRRRGLRLPEIWRAVERGEVRAMHVFGHDVAQTDANAGKVRRALKALDFLAVQEPFASETAAFADVVLPASTFLEKDGTVTNAERRVQLVRKVVDPPGEARPDLEIICGLAGRLGRDLGFTTATEVMDEIARLVPTYAGVSFERLEREGSLTWPCLGPEHPGEPRLYEERFATPSGRARLAPVTYRPPGEQADKEFPMVLITGRRLEHYNAGTMTRRTDNLVLAPGEQIEMHPEDAGRLGIETGARLTLESRRGYVEAPALVTDRVRPGELFMAFHFPEAPTNLVTSDQVDEHTDCAEFKVTAVRARASGSGRD